MTISAAHEGHYRGVLHGHLVACLDEDTLHAVPKKVMGSGPLAAVGTTEHVGRQLRRVGMAGTALALRDSNEAGGEEAQKPVDRRPVDCVGQLDGTG
eukprot:SM000224S07089  [mRNA]  locus=s224:61882:62172:+ [translate_table: standard]